MRRVLNKELISSELQDKFGDKIQIKDYDNFSYRGIDYIENFVCSAHGEFKTSIYRLLNSQYGCKLCSPFGPKTWKYQKEKLVKVHGIKYDYSLVDNSTDENDTLKGSFLNIICKKHGVFVQRYGDHLKGDGCPTCRNEKRTSINKFLFESIKNHGDVYDYRLVFETFENKKVDIICEKHGIFSQNKNDHKRGVGCPKCKNNSKGETVIQAYLLRNNIGFVPQKTFDGLVGVKGWKLRFDFYIPSKNLLIEYDGSYHFKESNDGTIYDKLKTEFAKNNKIELCRIKYDVDNIQESLDDIFKEYPHKDQS